MSTLRLTATFCATLAIAALVWADDDDGFPEDAEVFPQELEEVETFENVPVEREPDIKQQAASFLEQFIRRELDHNREHDARKRELKRRLGQVLSQIHSGEVRAQQHGVLNIETAPVGQHVGDEGSLGNASAEPFEAPGGPGEEPIDRLGHLRAAMMHLHEAGLPDVAELVRQRAEAIERQAPDLNAHDRPPLGLHETVHALVGQVEQLRDEVDSLRADVNALHTTTDAPKDAR